ncbi:hypothetical protein ScPMuIL_009081 [Solemya velum]
MMMMTMVVMVMSWQEVDGAVVSYGTTSGMGTYVQNTTSPGSFYSIRDAQRLNRLYKVGAYLRQSFLPVFSNLPRTVRIPVNTRPGTMVFDVVWNTTDGSQFQQLSFSLMPSPNITLYNVNKNTGVVTVNSNLSVGTHELRIQMADMCGRVSTSFLWVDVVSDKENETGSQHDRCLGLALYLVEEKLNTSFPFNLESRTGKILLGQQLDFELVSLFNLTFAITNGTWISKQGVLVIEVIDVNEPPMFAVSRYTVRTKAGPAGQAFPEIHYYVTDPDFEDTLIYRLVTESSSMHNWLLINATTGQLSYRYDYDTSRNDVPEMFAVEIEVEDSRGMIDSATLHIFIDTPEDDFVSDEFASDTIFVFYLPKCSPINTVILESLLEVVGSPRNVVPKMSLKMSPGSKYFAISPDGNIYLLKPLTETNETFINLHVEYISNGEYRTITVYVIITHEDTDNEESMSNVSKSYNVTPSQSKSGWILGFSCLNIIILVLILEQFRHIKQESSKTVDAECLIPLSLGDCDDLRYQYKRKQILITTERGSFNRGLHDAAYV